ncbi:hypothetical protein ACFPC0_10740 [Streptomyces andamanensis]|uniref:ParB/Sulfiredoxin domain-containing protein n=1 Tax=Streptomyces andamanensis TaxID=1565035 RepID=A0ABV8TCG2_9ACTN
MSNNPHALKIIRAVGQTPGFTIEAQSKDRYKLIRFAIPAHGIPEQTITISSRSADRQYHNDVTRLKNKLGWTEDLFARMEDLAREHRIAETDPTDDINKALLTALGVDPAAAEDGHERADVPAPRKRHSKGGTATGSARRPATQAQPAEASSLMAEEAPVQVLQGTGRMQAEIITPLRAVDLLVNNAAYQRKMDEKKVRDYAAAMRRREWMLNPADPICIDVNGRTANGQHRLQACIEAEVPFPCWVAYDTPEETYAIMDRGKKRTTSDMLHGAGEINTGFLASVARLAYLWFNVEQDQWRSVPEVTEAQVFATLESHPNLRESVKYGRFSKMRVSTTASMLAHYLISRKMGGDHRLVTRWYKAVSEMDLNRGEPGHTLGLYFMQTAPAAKRRTALHGRDKRDLEMYLIIQAWNNTCLGKEVRSVAWKTDFVIPDPVTPKDGVHTFPPLS